MIRRIFAVMVVAVILLGTGCGRDTNGEGAGAYSIEDFFPRVPNRLKFFEGSQTNQRLDANGNLTVDENVIMFAFFEDHIHEHRHQTRTLAWIDGWDFTSVAVYELGDGQLRIINSAVDFVDHTDITDEEPWDNMIVLAEPLVVGNSWIRFQAGNIIERAQILSMNTEITVPYGTFEAMVVEVTVDALGQVTREYFVRELGLVQTVVEGPHLQSLQQLSDINYSPFMGVVHVFTGWDVHVEMMEDDTPLFSHVPIGYMIPMEIPTNADLIPLYMETFRTFLSENMDFELDPAIDINFIEFDRFPRLLHVDFTEAFLTTMTALGDQEEHVLQLVADTLGAMYRAFEVTFSIDGAPYASENVTIDPAQGDRILLTMFRDLNDPEHAPDF